jgi:predicted ATPase/DNA-binding XRE family transcriptional regulator
MQAASLGHWVKQRRKELDLTQEELALRVHCSMVLIQKIESGERRPSRQIAALLAEHLNVPLDERSEFIRFARERFPVVANSQSIAWRSLRQRFTNLPIQPTPLFGREQAVEKIKQRILSKQARFLTLVGPPGVGKTRLGLEVAIRLVNDFEDGVFFIPLASATTSDMVLANLARIFSIPEYARKPNVELIKNYLADKRLFLLLDNLEQVITAAPILAELLAACPWIQMLVTSRVSLHIRAERQYHVRPLEFAAYTPIPDLAALQQYPAIAMFLDRAQAIDPDFELTSGNAVMVAEICALLDGLPLAIELVVSHMDRLPLPQLLCELKKRLPLLTSGPLDLPVRHHSLRQAIDWSYDLLDPDEQRIFSRLSVFVGGCTLEAARFVCGDDSCAFNRSVITNLADKNLVNFQAPENGDPAHYSIDLRFMMLETIREYAIERLEQRNDKEAVREKHATYFLDLLERADPVQKYWLERLEREHDNLRAALRWMLVRGDAKKALRLSGAAWRFWQMHGHLREGLAWLNSTLALESTCSDQEYSQARANTLLGAGWLLRDYGDWMQMKTSFEDSLSLYQDLDDPSGLAYALYSAGYANFLVGDAFHGIRMIQKSLDLYRSAGDKRGVALALMMLGRISVGQGDYKVAKGNFTECLRLVQELESNYGTALTIGNLGELALYSGDYENASSHLEESHKKLNQLGETQLCAWVLTKRSELAWSHGFFRQAREFLEESLALARQFGYRWNEAYSLTYLGLVTIFDGDPEKAQSLCETGMSIFRELNSEGDIAQAKKGLAFVKLQSKDFLHAARNYQECLEIFMERGHKPDIAECLEGLAVVKEEQGYFCEAARLLGAAQGLRETIGFLLPPVLCETFEKTLNSVHENLDNVIFETLFKQGWAEGSGMCKEYPQRTYDGCE